MKVVYIAGPFRGPNTWAIAENVRAAESLGLRVAGMGAMPLIPHANTHLFHGQLTDEFWLDGTKELLRRCDAVVLTRDYRRSSGSMLEIAEANRLGLPVFCFWLGSEQEEFHRWVKTGAPKRWDTDWLTFDFDAENTCGANDAQGDGAEDNVP